MNLSVRSLFKPYLTALVALSVAGCSGSSDNNDGNVNNNPGSSGGGSGSINEPKDAKVVGLGVDKSTLQVGESATVSATVTYGETRVLQGGERVVLVFSLPPGVEYVPDSTGITTEKSSNNANPNVVNCPGGESFVSYDLGATELSGANDPDGREDADFKIIFLVDGTGLSGDTVISAAAADNSLAHGCGQNFAAEASTGIEVQS